MNSPFPKSNRIIVADKLANGSEAIFDDEFKTTDIHRRAGIFTM
jgi:hypothetical protein